MKATIATILLTATLLVGCNTNPSNEGVGTVIGGVGGGLLGSQIGGGKGRVAATIVGTIVGGYIGGNVGRSMDDVDRMKMNRALETQPTRTAARWTNPDTGARYATTPLKTYTEERTGRPCREFVTSAYIGGREESIYGIACRQNDGSWEVVK